MSIRQSILKQGGRNAQFNMTAMIDIVFLLIIFFMLVCQFITRENYSLILPDACPSAVVDDTHDESAVTVSVFKDSGDGLTYAVRGLRFMGTDVNLVSEMSREIRFETGRKKDTVVHLRADGELSYVEVQTALKALARAGVERVQLAAYRSDQNRGDK